MGNPVHFRNGKQYCNLISILIAQNKLKFVPVKVYPSGLLGVAEGIEYMRLGKVCFNVPVVSNYLLNYIQVHAEKIVYRIADTPQSKIAKYM